MRTSWPTTMPLPLPRSSARPCGSCKTTTAMTSADSHQIVSMPRTGSPCRQRMVLVARCSVPSIVRGPSPTPLLKRCTICFCADASTTPTTSIISAIKNKPVSAKRVVLPVRKQSKPRTTKTSQAASSQASNTYSMYLKSSPRSTGRRNGF